MNHTDYCNIMDYYNARDNAEPRNYYRIVGNPNGKYDNCISEGIMTLTTAIARVNIKVGAMGGTVGLVLDRNGAIVARRNYHGFDTDATNA